MIRSRALWTWQRRARSLASGLPAAAAAKLRDRLRTCVVRACGGQQKNGFIVWQQASGASAALETFRLPAAAADRPPLLCVAKDSAGFSRARRRARTHLPRLFARGSWKKKGPRAESPCSGRVKG